MLNYFVELGGSGTMKRDDIRAMIKQGWEHAERSNSGRTRKYFADLLDHFPGDPTVEYAYACALDFSGDEMGAAQAYARCQWEKLDSEDRARGWIQYAATLRNIGHLDDAMQVIQRAREEGDRDSLAPVMYEALILVDRGQPVAAVRRLLTHLLETNNDELVRSYSWALRRYIMTLPPD